MHKSVPYSFTKDDLRLVDQVHRLITNHSERFKAAGTNLNKRYSVERVLKRERPPIPEKQRKGMLDRALSGEEPDQREVERLAARIGDGDAARALVIHSHVVALALPSREQWEPLGRRLSLAAGDVYRDYLPVETPSPSWEWSAHVLLVFWLLIEPRAEAVPPKLTEFQGWKWDAPEPTDLYPDEVQNGALPRSFMPFTVPDWPTLLNGVRRAMRAASRLGLVPTSDPQAEESPEVEVAFPLLSPKELAAHDLLLAQNPVVPITSVALCARLVEMKHYLSDDVFRKHVAKKLRPLGLQAHPKLGYFYPLGSLARRLGPQGGGTNPESLMSH